MTTPAIASRRPFLRTLCAALALPGLLAVSPAFAGGVEKLKSFLESTHTLRADFSQTVTTRSGRKPQVTTGQLLLSRPGKFRWEQQKPYPQLLVGDGEKIWLYDPELKQVTVKKFTQALSGTPAALLAGDNNVEKRFTLTEQGERDGLAWVEAVPKQTDGGFERIRLGFGGDTLRAMELTDSFGQTTSLTFPKLERNPSLPPATFRFTPPAGADVTGE